LALLNAIANSHIISHINIFSYIISSSFDTWVIPTATSILHLRNKK